MARPKDNELPEGDYALALRILATARRTSSKAVATAWQDEVVRRIEQLRRGEVETESWTQVQAQLDEALSR